MLIKFLVKYIKIFLSVIIFASQELQMFSKSCEYALKAMIYVGKNTNENKKVGVKEIAYAIDSPEPFVGKILQQLTKNKLVLSTKGPNGGFYMTGRELRTTLLDIIYVIDGEGVSMDCVLGLKKCSELNPCPVHHEYKHIKKLLLQMLDLSIKDFNEKIDSGRYFLKNINHNKMTIS
jgi:Rrf2 family protein